MSVKYYDGPGGVFYDDRNDKIFTLTPRTEMIVKIREGSFAIVGRYYDYRSLTAKIKKTAITDLEAAGVIRLGDL